MYKQLATNVDFQDDIHHIRLVMSFIKNKLKLARDALSKKDYIAARDAATQVLEYDSENYNASAQIWIL